MIDRVGQDQEVTVMAGLLKRRHEAVEPVWTSELTDVFDRMFDDWMSMWPFRRRALLSRWMPEDVIKVDEYRDGDTLVVRAELPGIDPDKDVELTMSDGMLHIEAERREEEKTEDKGYVRRELRYGSFTRSLPLPQGVTEADITATYKDGILEIRIPTSQPAPGKKITVTKA
jgi:HSP20 family protein